MILGPVTGAVVGFADAEAVGEPDGFTDEDALGLGDPLADALGFGDPLELGLTDADALGFGDPLAVGLTLGFGVSDGVGVGDEGSDDLMIVTETAPVPRALLSPVAFVIFPSLV